MRWIVGLDLREESVGPIAMARWLHAHGTTPDHHTFIGVHVIEPEVHAELHDAEVGAITADAEAYAREVVDQQDALAAFSRIDVVIGDRAERSLQAGYAFHGAAGILIGRHGPAKSKSLIRLGPVARRMLRWLPSPVMVVPPDLMASDIGGGPIVACVDGSEGSLTACRYARRLADGLSRKLALVRVAPSPDALELAYLTKNHAAFRPPDIAAAEQDVTRWIETHGLRVDDVIVHRGSVIAELLGAANDLDSPILVSGARRLTLPERLFHSSVGTTLARGAACSVVIVAPAEP